MNYKNYLILDRWGNYNHWQPRFKIRKGMVPSDMAEILKFADKEWVPGANERIYFFPGCTVPRFKVREKFSVTIKPEYATTAFISPKTMGDSDNMFNELKNMVPVDDKLFEKWLTINYGKNHHLTVKYKSLILNCTGDILMNLDDVYSCFYTYGPTNSTGAALSFRDILSNMVARKEIGNDQIHLHNPRSYRSGYSREDDTTSLYIPAEDCQIDELSCDIFPQDVILKVLNEDNTVIDEKRYQELQMMGQSTDDENLVLMMEIMANANYDKSFVYLLLLLKEFNTKIAARKEKSHVNFKGLLNYFELDERKFNHVTIEQLTKTMKKLGKFTRTNVQRITQHFGTQHQNNFNSEHYTTGPVLKPEYENQLDDYCIDDSDDIEIPEVIIKENEQND